jgi:hypothetical protein
MIYNLDERATLFGGTGSADGAGAATEGTLRDLVALVLTWDAGRFAAARIETVTQEVYAPDMIETIAREAGIEAAGDEGHPS